MIFVETPTNPAMYDVDIAKLSALCKEKGIVLVVDNTLMTHLLCQPLDLGASIALYSLTKSINGHGDVVGGLLSTGDQMLYKKLKNYRDNTGLILDPFSAWLTIRGLRTLPLRMRRQEETAQRLIGALQRHPKIEKIRYPGFSPFREQNKFKGGGGVFSIDLKSKQHALAFVRALRLLKIGTTFGNLESLCYHFGGFARPSRDINLIGIPYGLVRISVGIEDFEDIRDDLFTALDAVPE
jgi:cystathionine beta-lyase/cystathionine gamma-synthase